MHEKASRLPHDEDSLNAFARAVVDVLAQTLTEATGWVTIREMFGRSSTLVEYWGVSLF